MTKIAPVIAAYLKNGDAEVMNKIETYLIQNFNIDNKTINDIRNLNLEKISNDIGLHLTIDIQTLDKKQQSKHIEYFVSIIKKVFIDILKTIERENGKTEVFNFINEFEEHLKIANLIHNNALQNFIHTFEFDKVREHYLKPDKESFSKNKTSKTYLLWNKDENKLNKLAFLLKEDYGIIKAPIRFQNFFLRKSSFFNVNVNENKIGHFVCLINKLKQEKYLLAKGGKGFWIYLAENTFDFSGELLDKNKSKFKSLNSSLKKENAGNQLIINEIEEIFKQIVS